MHTLFSLLIIGTSLVSSLIILSLLLPRHISSRGVTLSSTTWLIVHLRHGQHIVAIVIVDAWHALTIHHRFLYRCIALSVAHESVATVTSSIEGLGPGLETLKITHETVHILSVLESGSLRDSRRLARLCLCRAAPSSFVDYSTHFQNSNFYSKLSILQN